MILFKDVQLVNRGIIQDCDLVVDGEKIVQIARPGELDMEALGSSVDSVHAKGLYLSHGFIDTHVHGGGGHDYMDGTEEAWMKPGLLHVKHGTTGIVPTTLSSDPSELLTAVSLYESIKAKPHKGARILGIHIEGPYLSPMQSGAQDPKHLRTPNPTEYEAILDASDAILKWTIAPELPGVSAMARALVQRGIVPCIGHSNATATEVRASLLDGFRIVTHLYSACSTITRQQGFRHAGVVESAYIMDALMSEIIADGCHLPGDLLQMAYRFIGPERLILVTDAMRAAGQQQGESILGSLSQGQRVILEDGVAKMPDRQAFAGSIATADRLVRTMLSLTSATLAEAIQMITETPARALGLSHQIGIVEVGRQADLVLFDEDINVKLTMVSGQICYSNLEGKGA